jgi:esterase/lipase superfamily enzyme
MNAFNDDFWVSSPLHFLPRLGGMHLDKLRQRFVLLPSGEGRAEDIGESWALAKALGAQGVPNRVISWGPEWPHDWDTWRHMLPQYLDEWTREK